MGVHFFKRKMTPGDSHRGSNGDRHGGHKIVDIRLILRGNYEKLFTASAWWPAKILLSSL